MRQRARFSQVAKPYRPSPSLRSWLPSGYRNPVWKQRCRQSSALCGKCRFTNRPDPREIRSCRDHEFRPLGRSNCVSPPPPWRVSQFQTPATLTSFKVFAKGVLQTSSDPNAFRRSLMRLWVALARSSRPPIRPTDGPWRGPIAPLPARSWRPRVRTDPVNRGDLGDRHSILCQGRNAL